MITVWVSHGISLWRSDKFKEESIEGKIKKIEIIVNGFKKKLVFFIKIKFNIIKKMMNVVINKIFFLMMLA